MVAVEFNSMQTTELFSRTCQDFQMLLLWLFTVKQIYKVIIQSSSLQLNQMDPHRRLHSSVFKVKFYSSINGIITSQKSILNWATFTVTFTFKLKKNIIISVHVLFFFSPNNLSVIKLWKSDEWIAFSWWLNLSKAFSKGAPVLRVEKVSLEGCLSSGDLKPSILLEFCLMINYRIRKVWK